MKNDLIYIKMEVVVEEFKKDFLPKGRKKD